MKKDLILKLHEIGAVKFGRFTLKSGMLSPIYFDLRRIISYPSLLVEIGDLLWSLGKSAELICGVPYTALPIATAISIKRNIPMVMRRKEKKEYGTRQSIEGVFQKGQSCLLIEDLITSGKSVEETLEPLEEAGLRITNILAVIDREQGGVPRLREKGYEVDCLITLSEILKTLGAQGLICQEKIKEVEAACRLH